MENINPLALENPPAENPPNEPITTAGAPLENSPDQSLFKTITDAGNSILEKIKPGRGRPRKDGAPKISDTVIRETVAAANPGILPASQIPAPQPPPPVPDTRNRSLFRRTIALGIKAIKDFANKFLLNKGIEAGMERDFMEKTVAACEPEPELMDTLLESIDLLCEKYQVNTEKAPEIALGVCLFKFGAPYGMALQAINAEIKRKRAIEVRDRNIAVANHLKTQATHE